MGGCCSRKKPLGGACVSHLGFLSIGTGNKPSNAATTAVFPGTKTLGACGLGSAVQTGTETPEQAQGAMSGVSGPTAQLCSTSLKTAQLCSTSLMTAPLCSTSLTVQLCTGKGNTGKTSSSCTTRGAAYPIKHYCGILLGNFSTSNLTDTFFKPMLSLQILMTSKSVF